MERVRYWDGERRGKADGTGLVVDGPRWYGALRCFRVRMDNGGTDWICETHVERELANGAGVKTTP
jgi:hypothetical protein